ncbi:hypothetical protein C2W62_00850 [Candidatus Entotheonella serta]|nr:hypothetical protein C2W62_00850 [Candidatus Entotheonella serta]
MADESARKGVFAFSDDLMYDRANPYPPPAANMLTICRNQETRANVLKSYGVEENIADAIVDYTSGRGQEVVDLYVQKALSIMGIQSS